MKKVSAKGIGIIAAVVIIGGFGVWYYVWGPHAQANIERAGIAVERAAKTGTTADKALEQVSALPEKWQTLNFDETAEATRIAEDLVASRQYKVDNYRDPAAAAVAKDINAAEKSLAKVAKDLAEAHAELNQTLRPFLPDDTADKISAALTENEITSSRVKKMRGGLKELKSDNFIWGHLGIVIKANSGVMTSLEQADEALSTGDYVVMQQSTASSRQHLADCTDWLQAGEQELINVGIYSKDSAGLKRFISHATDTTLAYEQATIFLFGPRADAAALKQATTHALEEMAGLRKIAETQVFDRGYKTWFLGSAKRRL